MKVLVTGGAGFIGSNIAHTLVERGKETIVLDSLITGDERNIADIRKDITFINGDIRDVKTAQSAVKGVDFVLHQAALNSVPRSIKMPRETLDINVMGTLNLLIAARDEGVKRFIFASSSSVYGNTPTLPKMEDMPLNPIAPYPTSKLACELLVRQFCQYYGLDTVSLRYFNIFGPRQNRKSEYAAVVPKFITAMLAGRRPTIYGDGMQTRDFTYVQNAVDANLLAMGAKKCNGEVVNIATGRQITLNRLVEIINGHLGTDIKPIYEAPRAGDVLHALADVSKAKALIGYEPKYTVEDGLKKTIEWFKGMKE